MSQPPPRIKICCIRDPAEAALAIGEGVDALGLVSAMPSGPGVIDEAAIAAIAATVPPPIATFLLTSSTDADAIVAQQRRCRCNTVQLVDAVAPGTHARLREALPGIALVQVVHVVDAASVDEAVALAPAVDALLLDSGNPALAVKELGGTGRVHDWALSRAIVERCGKPVFLAGGLRPDNVADAIRTVRPFGLDLCNGVRSDGRLDARKLAAFIGAVRAA
ncbi:phosphoribosylanthranilate isomerase [Tahibacter caeni]|uniref:phosphoribosylanthranilate isomerase n=1 Tax=Tahibacter caeni TaxID=1453545 RepID=UPI002148C1C4|nr:phosphoribosylanthranilate isomerase [Tahibacter caeni]